MDIASPTDVEWRVREGLREIIDADRADYLGFAIPVVLLTPPILAMAIAIFVFVSPVAGASPWIQGPNGVMCAVSVALGGMLVALLVGQPPDIRRNPTLPLIGAVLAYGAILALGYGTSWMVSKPILFWSLVALLLLLMLAFLGWLYEPSDHYYLGWVAGPIVIDNPTTFRDDVDRGHIALGFAAALPAMVLGAYGEIFGTVRVLRARSKLRLLEGRQGLKLTGKGRDLIKAAHGSRG